MNFLSSWVVAYAGQVLNFCSYLDIWHSNLEIIVPLVIKNRIQNCSLITQKKQNVDNRGMSEKLNGKNKDKIWSRKVIWEEKTED